MKMGQLLTKSLTLTLLCKLYSTLTISISEINIRFIHFYVSKCTSIVSCIHHKLSILLIFFIDIEISD